MLKYLSEKSAVLFRNNLEVLLLVMLISGCTITIGTTSRETVSHGSTYHYVRAGENLFRISKYYYGAETVKETNEGIARIKGANKMKGDQLFAGQKLLIPSTSKKQPSYPLLPPDKALQAAMPQATSPEQPDVQEFRPIIADKVFIWPIAGKIICGFGELDNQGIDILAEPGTTVLASDGGKVAFAGTTQKYQETVIIGHSENIYTVYSHDLDITVKKGDAVQKGDIIGKIKSGTTRIRYLHFEIRIDNIAVNPLVYLPQQ
ncbi:MAG: LysM peptidoglycan-binding domain-containing M23 family metallopeptidase [Candidatus Omnitrophica bacterium]|nr:LysM peptidoglycan-binding domain-containing M23 family metallopeptidase [Candidatus Omnitrophota bacterium]